MKCTMDSFYKMNVFYIIPLTIVLYSIKEDDMKSNGGFISSQIRHLSSRIFEKMLRNSGVDAFNGAQGRILYVLWENENLTITEIGKMTGLAKSTLTSMLDHMEKGELITRIQNPKNRKQIFIQITEKAKSYKEQYDAISKEMTNLTY